MATSLILLKITVLLSISRAQILQEMTRINVTKEDMDGIEDYTDLTIDQIIMQSLGGLEVAAMKMLTPGGNILAELDMVLTEKQYHDLYSPPEYGAMEMMPYFENKRKKRKAVRRNDLRWPNGVVPYTFARNHFSAKEVYGIKTAMREWEKYTCIKFREAESTDHNFVRFQNGPGCNSQLGMVGGQQILNLDANGCRWKGLYLHEIGHALGLVHEHQLPNRDDFITILYHNVAPSMRVWFQKYTDTEVNQYDVNYQLSSVMHYGTTAFSADGRSTTIRPKNNTNTDSIGKVWKKELAFTDVKAVNRMYECAAHCPSTMKCKNGGFVDQNCKCICPDGTDECVDDGGNGNVIPRRENDPCVNMYDDWPCNVWAKQGECEVNPRFMKVSCKKACRVCKSQQDKSKENHIATFAWQWLGMFADIFPSNWAMDVCEDSFKGDKCDDWAKNGDCVTNEEWMNENCKKACGLCNNADTTPNIDVTCTDIHSNIDECKKWARKGECQFNKNWMSKNCKKTCKVCEGTVSDEPKKRPRQRYDRNDQDPIDRDTNDGSCADIHNTKECQEWAKRRECFRNPKWMIPNCRKSCRKCQDGTCKNLYDDTKCRRWAQNRECIKNPTWMGDNCALSCNTCQTEDDSTRVGRRGNDDSNTNNNAKDVPKDDPTTNDGSGCRNDHNDKECNVWAKYGHCDINPSYMHKSCKLACGKCAGIREDSNVGTRNRNDRQNDRSRDETRINTTTKPTTTTVTSTTCRDINPSCPSWAKQGICASNPGYALINCRKTCGVCDKPCVDRHTFCVIWANENHCETNAGYMLWFCSKSCKNC